jgi:hypothetical protein
MGHHNCFDSPALPCPAPPFRDSQVQKVVLAALELALRVVPGGYLCRVQKGDFKYMIAFCDAQVRLKVGLCYPDIQQRWEQQVYLHHLLVLSKYACHFVWTAMHCYT